MTQTQRVFSRSRKRSRKGHGPALRFTPTAWAKLLYLRDAGPTEVGGFGISADGDPLLVEDVRLVTQSCTATTIAFDDAAVADHFDVCVDAGLAPEQFARIWIHTHPGNSARPSGTDERTFARVFGGCDWAVMAILAKGGARYARLRFNAGPGGELIVPVEIDFSPSFFGANPIAWSEEYERCVGDASARVFRSAERSRPGSRRDLSDAVDFETVPLPALRSDLFEKSFPATRIWEFHDECDCAYYD